MSLRTLKWLTVFLPPVVIGGFEYIRHDLLLGYVSMETGNLYIAGISLIISYLFAEWAFRRINSIHKRLGEEQSRRAVYEERERLANELHDDIAQMLFFLNVKLKQAEVDEAKSVLSDIDSYLRQAIFSLRSSPEESMELSNRIGTWLNDWCVVTGITADKDIEIQPDVFSRTEEVQLFGIIQEAFTNIRKHSGAVEASILFHASREGGILSIKDNGSGVEDDSLQSKRYGLPMMRKRASEMGHRSLFTIRTAKERRSE